jgi:hypothetical protein
MVNDGLFNSISLTAPTRSHPRLFRPGAFRGGHAFDTAAAHLVPGTFVRLAGGINAPSISSSVQLES